MGVEYSQMHVVMERRRVASVGSGVAGVGGSGPRAGPEAADVRPGLRGAVLSGYTRKAFEPAGPSEDGGPAAPSMLHTLHTKL